MSYRNALFFVIVNVLVFCDSAFVDTLSKCHINDAECQTKLMQQIVKDIAEQGIPELNIPTVDPMILANVTIEIPTIMQVTLVEGQAKGAKNCVINKFDVIIEDERAFADITCDITIKGKYKAFSANPLIKTLLNGDTVHGEGNGKVKIEKLNVKFDYYFFVQERDGEYYIKTLAEKTKYDFDIKGRVKFYADNLYVGNVESSKTVVKMLNDNWKFLMTSFGKPFMDTAIMYFKEFLGAVFDAVPVKHFIIDDLSKYARPSA